MLVIIKRKIVLIKNDCHLEVASCKAFRENGVDIHLEHEGECEQRAPVQECPIMCTADFRPVCASNGKTYTNQCRLDVANCRSKMANAEEIVKVHDGVCKQESRRSAENPCMKFCTKIMAPVCSSDGKTFDNKCLFEIAQCEQGMIGNEIILAHDGPCKAEYGAEDSCLKPCIRMLAPVCSSDGQTLGNKCLFEIYQCQQAKENKQVNMIHDGACQASKREVEDRCFKPCNKMLKPVCSSDGQTFGNQCLFEVYQCHQAEQNQEVTMVHEGPCQRSNREAEDSCLKPCNKMLKPVCSSDGQTIGNKCLFDIYQCQQSKRNHAVRLVHNGPCTNELKMPDRCAKPCDKMRNPVCSSDGKTLGNKCLFEIYECQQRNENKEVTIVHDGACREKRSEDSCIKPCFRIMAPVCSSDGKTLPNKCEFEVYQCQQAKENKVVSMVHDGACEESAPKDPCMRACPQIWAPVCSSDGKTLQNKCQFEAYQCMQRRENKEVTLVHSGECRAKRSEDSCMKPCFKIMAPVCSSDGKTLPNKCEFEVYQCQQAKHNNAVTMVHDGACDSKRSLEEDPCFKDCAINWAPVCSSDNMDHYNECHFEMYKCIMKSHANIEVTIAHAGECTESAPKDPCQKPCPKIRAPVCSTDGESFENECTFDIYRCQQARNNLEVTIAHQGPCSKDPCHRACPEIYRPVCSSDGKTLDNACMFEAYACEQMRVNNRVVIVHEGRCSAASSPIGAAPAAVNPCLRICDRMYAPVCASDGKTLNNKCLFEEYQCERRMKNEEVVLVHDGAC